ncbi:hypothetical protein TIFTF001_018726 [Ficus carica]|uniref:Uncharacterized protein n=1 Tax=Ficus carica TaxID=3494 RepID=A0AA88DJA0_FICCA|nr:hypothetical protein TIFTF001_018726 [Ficus carica]
MKVSVGEEWEAAEHVVCSSFSVLSDRADITGLVGFGLGLGL